MIELGIETVDITPEIASRLSGFGARAKKPSMGNDATLKARAIAIRVEDKHNF